MFSLCCLEFKKDKDDAKDKRKGDDSDEDEAKPLVIDSEEPPTDDQPENDQKVRALINSKQKSV